MNVLRVMGDPMMERFLGKVDKTSSTEGCWEWTAGKHERGYGYFYTSKEYSNRKMDYAHRVSLFLHKGERHDDLCVLHSCDNPSCVNPEHLRWGTHKDNMRDMTAKERGNHIFKWSLSTKEQMRDLRAFGYQVKEIAETYNVDRGHCSRICNGLA